MEKVTNDKMSSDQSPAPSQGARPYSYDARPEAAELSAQVAALLEEIAALRAAVQRSETRVQGPASSVEGPSRSPTSGREAALPIYELKQTQPVGYEPKEFPPPEDPEGGLFAGPLDRARIQWLMGDWEGLAKMDLEQIRLHPDRGKLALLAGIGLMHSGQCSKGKDMLNASIEWGIPSQIVRSFLFYFAHLNLGNSFAFLNQTKRALLHFDKAQKFEFVGIPRNEITVSEAAQKFDQLRLQFPRILRPIEDSADSFSDDKVLSPSIRAGLQAQPDSVPLLIAAAETFQRHGRLAEAIRYWQRLAAVEGPSMDFVYYQRLAKAYEQIKSFPPGPKDQEECRGSEDKYKVFEKIHRLFQPASYLEIGVQSGRSLALASCQSVGVDPMPMISVPLPPQAKIVRVASDLFFKETAQKLFPDTVDLVFIDGMHLFEYALRDFINVEKLAGPQTLVVIDDILPCHPAQAARERRTRAWTGDVWKLVPTLRRYRPELSLILLDAYPTGLLLIHGMNPQNTILQESYNDIVSKWSIDAPPPNSVIEREGAFQCNYLDLGILLSRLKSCEKGCQGEIGVSRNYE
jgi:tetratricopeptide (TPR) repeat protein